MNRFHILTLGGTLLLSCPVLGAEDCTGSGGIDRATNYLGDQGGLPPLPSGGVCWGQVPMPALAQYDANTQRITIDRDNIEALAPGVTDVDQRGGIIAIIVYHELYHANGDFGHSICDEVRLQMETADWAHSLIAQICASVPGANIRDLCEFYEQQANCYNSGCTTDGGAMGAWTNNNCPGSFPGSIPSSSACANIQPDGTCPIL